jgi:hypothetical protein
VGATEEIIKMAKENNGMVTTAMVVEAGFIPMRRPCFCGI